MAIIDEDGLLVRVNPKLSKILGQDPSTLVGLSFPSVFEMDKKAFEQFLTSKKSSYSCEVEFVRGSGEKLWLDMGLSMVSDPPRAGTEERHCILMQLTDITAQKNREQQLDLVINSTTDGFWDWHIADDYEYMSPRFWDIFGYLPHEKTSHPSEWQKLIFEEDLQVALTNFKLHVDSRGKHPFCQEVRYRHKMGHTVWVLCRGNVVSWDKDENPIRMVGTHTDITELKATQQELQSQRSRHAHSTRLAALGELAGSVAHEINNPLTVIAGHARLIRKQLADSSQLSSRLADSAKIIEKTVARMATVISGLKNFARDGRSDDWEEFDLDDLVNEVLSLCQDRYARSEVSIEVSDKIKNAKVWGQRTQLAQVFINLLNNSFDAIQASKERWVRFSLEECDEFLTIFVEDSGQGISQEVEKNIMQPFFTTKKSGEGTGIGLSIVKNITEKHFGDFYLDKSVPHTRFAVKLPKTGPYASATKVGLKNNAS